MSKQRTYFGERPATPSLTGWFVTCASVLLALAFAIQMVI